MESFLQYPFSLFYPRFIQILFLLLVVSVVFAYSEIRKYLSGFSRKTLIALGLILLAAALLRGPGIPHRHIVLMDEAEHINVAQNLSTGGRLWITVAGTPRHCERGILSLWPPTHHVLLAGFFSVFGYSEALAFFLTVLLAVLTLVLVFWDAFLLFKDEQAGLLAAAVFCVLPVHLKYSGTTVLEISSVFFTALALVAALLLRRSEKPALFWVFVASLFLTVYARPENVALVFFLAVVAFRHVPLRFILLGILLSVPLFLQIYSNRFVFPIPEWAIQGQQGVEFFKANVLKNLSSWFTLYFPWILTGFSVWGSRVLWRSKKRMVIWAWSWVLFFVLAFSFYCLRADRNAMNIYIPMVLLACAGLRDVWQRWEHKTLYRCLLMVVLAVAGYMSFLPLSVQSSSRAAVKEYEFMRYYRDWVSDETFVISTNPALLNVLGKCGVQPEYLMELPSWPQEMFFLKGAWWLKRKGGYEVFVRRLEREYSGQTVASVPLEQARFLELIHLKKRLT